MAAPLPLLLSELPVLPALRSLSGLLGLRSLLVLLFHLLLAPLTSLGLLARLSRLLLAPTLRLLWLLPGLLDALLWLLLETPFGGLGLPGLLALLALPTLLVLSGLLLTPLFGPPRGLLGSLLEALP